MTEVNLYAPPLANCDVDADQAAQPTQMTKEEVDAFVQTRTDYYWQRWYRSLMRSGSGAGWNWAAFFFGHTWFFYRKLYREGAALLGLYLVTFVLVYTIVAFAGVDERDADRFTTLALRVAAGVLANRIYLARAKRAVAKARSMSPEPMAVAALLRVEGGTSIVAALCVGPILSVVTLLLL